MVFTNELLSIGLSLIAGFTNSVPIIQGAAPNRVEDCKKIVVGSPESAIDLFVKSDGGGEFWIHEGAVYRFASKASFLQLQNPEYLTRFRGEPKLNRDEVGQLAMRIIRKLARIDKGIVGSELGIDRQHDGAVLLPIYVITWPNKPSHGRFDYKSVIEIDARYGKVTFLDLRDQAFYNSSFAQTISNNVYIPEVESNSPPRQRAAYPIKRPTPNQAEEVIESWNQLFPKCGIHYKGTLALDTIDWSRTLLYTDADRATNVPIYQLRFSDGSCLESIGGVVFNYVAGDACFTGFYMNRPKELWGQFEGQVKFKWDLLTADLESRFVTNCGVPREFFRTYIPGQRFTSPDVGSHGITRIVVDWRNWPTKPGRYSVSSTTLALSAEFDLQSAEIKSITFNDKVLLSYIARSLRGQKN